MKYYIRENGKWYISPLLTPLRPYCKHNLDFDIIFPESSWYPKQDNPGWNKTLMLGRFFHYGDYMTMAWRWDDPRPGDAHVLRGRVLRLAAYWHDEWGLYQVRELPFTFLPCKDILIGYYRFDDETIWTCYQEGVTPHPVESYVHREPIIIEGNWLRNPYFGGQERAYYQHTLDIKIR